MKASAGVLGDLLGCNGREFLRRCWTSVAAVFAAIPSIVSAILPIVSPVLPSITSSVHPVGDDDGAADRGNAAPTLGCQWHVRLLLWRRPRSRPTRLGWGCVR